jgi:hypothetical protein
MTDLGELVVRIKADAAPLESAMRNARGAVESGSAQMRTSLNGLKDAFRELLPAATVAGLVEFGHQTFEAADRINDLALRTGFAGSSLSALETPLKQSGSSLEEFSGAINRMNNMIGEAAKGNQDAIKAFDGLGLSIRKLQAMSPEQQFYAIAEALAQVKDQGRQTESGMNIFGRTFASILPTIKESHGELGKLVTQIKAAGGALTEDELKRIDEWGDAWVQNIHNVQLALVRLIDLPTGGAYSLGQKIGEIIRDKNLPPNVSYSPGKVMSWEEVQATLLKAKGGLPTTAKGGNADLLTPPKTSQLKDYLSDLDRETRALGLSERALTIEKAVIEAEGKAREDRNNKLRPSAELTDAERGKVEELTGAFYDLKKAQEENARIARHMKEQLADALADIAVNFDNLRDSATSAIQAIAKEIIKAKITTPLSSSIIDALPSFSFGKLLGFASGGSPPVGVPSIVGENGPEIFVPNTAGTVIPNGAIGGSVHFQQTIVMNPGATEQTVAQLRNLAPAIAAQAHASVMQAIQSGGDASRIVGRRS